MKVTHAVEIRLLGVESRRRTTSRWKQTSEESVRKVECSVARSVRGEVRRGVTSVVMLDSCCEEVAQRREEMLLRDKLMKHTSQGI